MILLVFLLAYRVSVQPLQYHVFLFIQVKELMLYIMILLVFLLAYGVSVQSLQYPDRDMFDPLMLKNILYYPYWQIYGELFLEELEGTYCTFELHLK